MKKIITITWILIFLICAGNIMADDNPPKTEKDFLYLLSPVRGHGGETSAPLYLQFELDKAVLTSADKNLLRELGKALQNEKLSHYRYRIEGHSYQMNSIS